MLDQIFSITICFYYHTNLRTTRPTTILLYLATPSAVRYNPIRRTFYPRLRNTGKMAKVTLVASMRNLLTILNAMPRDQAH